MYKKLKQDIKNINKVFATNFLDKVSKRTGFVKRSGKITAEAFLALNVFSGEDLCEKSLSELCGRLDAQCNIQVSSQALNERFNEDSVKFMQEIFNFLILQQNNTICTKHKKIFFNRILVNDSTSYELPEKFYNEFKGSGGSSSKSGVKIQLQGKAQGDKPSPLARVPGTTRLLSKLANEIKKDPNGVKSKGFLFLCKECICQVKIPLYSNPKFLFTL